MTHKELTQLHEDALRYCFFRLQHKRIENKVTAKVREAESYPCIILETVNIPNVGESICEYRIFSGHKWRKTYRLNVHLRQEGVIYLMTDRLYSGLTNGDIRQKNGHFFIAIHPHAIERYIERHKFEGSFEDAVMHILIHYRQVSYKKDNITKELICPFDTGVFLGYEDDEGILNLKTFVNNRQLYVNQRMDEVKAKEFGKSCSRIVED